MLFCIRFLRISSINFSYSLSLKVNWVYSLQYLFYHLLYMARAASRIWIHRLFFQCPIFGVRNNIWDQTFCVIELSLQLESRGEARRAQEPCKAFKIDKIKFEANSHLILDVFPPVFLSKIICIATSHSSGVMVNTTFPVMDKAIRGFKPNLNLYIRIVLN